MRFPPSTWGLCLALLQRPAVGQLENSPEPSNFLRRTGCKAIVIDDFVYIDGGEVSQLVDDEPSGGKPVNYTLSIDISKSWLVSDVRIAGVPGAPVDEEWNPEEWAPGTPVVRVGHAVWADGPRAFYSWGGHASQGIGAGGLATRSEWRFNTKGLGNGTWYDETPTNPDLLDSLTLSEDGAFATAHNTGFWIGGVSSGWTEPGLQIGSAIPGIVSFNITTKTWHNDSADGISEYGTLRAGQAQFVPIFGPNGLIFVLGGQAMSLGPAATAKITLQAFDKVRFFDPVTKEWYWQATTGKAPKPRLYFCAVGVEGQNGTYEIFIFGGRTDVLEERGSTFDDAFVLSVLGFVWSAVPASGGGTRSNHHCVVIGKRQMLSIGGSNPESGWDWPDHFPQGLGILDLADLTWGSDYDADADEYDSPKVVQDWYAQGGLESVEWSSKEVQKLFARPNKATKAPETGKSNTGPSSAKPVGAIVGGVIGGVALLIISVIAFVVLRRWNREGPRHLDGGSVAAAGLDGQDQQEYKHYSSGPPIVELPIDGPLTELDASGHNNVREP